MPCADLSIVDRSYSHNDLHSSSNNSTTGATKIVACVHCGCALVGELKKGRYVYYRCSGNKGDCGERYVREEVLEEEFSKAMGLLHFDEEILNWLTDALRHSHQDEQKLHAEAVDRLQGEYKRLQDRLDGMYIDKLTVGFRLISTIGRPVNGGMSSLASSMTWSVTRTPINPIWTRALHCSNWLPKRKSCFGSNQQSKNGVFSICLPELSVGGRAAHDQISPAL